MSERAAEFGEKASEKAAEFGEKAKEVAGATKEKAGAGLGTVGGKIRERAEQMGGTPGRIGAKVGSGIEQAGQYVQERQAGEMVKDFEHYVKEHPMQAVAGAVVAGIVVGRILR